VEEWLQQHHPNTPVAIAAEDAVINEPEDTPRSYLNLGNYFVLCDIVCTTMFSI
jgi:hypothetical protein